MLIGCRGLKLFFLFSFVLFHPFSQELWLHHEVLLWQSRMKDLDWMAWWTEWQMAWQMEWLMACQMAYRMAYQMAILTIMWVGLITLLCTMVDTDLDPCSHSPEVTTPMIIHMVAFLQTQLITGRLPLLPQYVLLVQESSIQSLTLKCACALQFCHPLKTIYWIRDLRIEWQGVVSWYLPCLGLTVCFIVE